MRTKCILCCQQINPNLGFYNIGDVSIESSKKTIKSILIHLSKCIQTDYVFEDNYCVCNSCYEKLVEYDQTMMKLLNLQKNLSSMLRDSINTFNSYMHINSSNDNNVLIEESVDDKDDEDGSDYSTNYVDSTNDSNQEFSENSSLDLSSPSFECNICDKRLNSKTSLKHHVESHTTAVKCKICGTLCKDEEYLELHMNIHEGKTENECRYCPKRYSRRFSVIRHMQFHWDKKKFQCEKCGLRFSQAHILYNHKMIHEAEEEPLICQICQQSFKSKKTFRHHMVTHQEDRPMHACGICGKKFTEKYTLKMHFRTHGIGREEVPETPKKNNEFKKFPCIICEKVLTTMESLESHRAREHDVITSSTVFVDT